MKKINIFIISLSALLMFFSAQSVAYGKDPKGLQDEGKFDREAFIAKRNAYIAEKVELTTEEAAVFFPLDNELLHKKFEVGRECRKMERELHDKKKKSDDECKKILKCREDVKEKRDKLDKEYLEKFKKILSAEQILKYQRADRDFFEEYFSDRNK